MKVIDHAQVVVFSADCMDFQSSPGCNCLTDVCSVTTIDVVRAYKRPVCPTISNGDTAATVGLTPLVVKSVLDRSCALYVISQLLHCTAWRQLTLLTLGKTLEESRAAPSTVSRAT